MTPLSEIFIAAAEILTREGAWTQKASARDRDGFEVPSCLDPRASSFDVLAAIELAIVRSLGRRDNRLFWDAIEFLFDTDKDALRFNDAPGRTQGQVVRLLRQAADCARDPAPDPVVPPLRVAALLAVVALIVAGVVLGLSEPEPRPIASVERIRG